MPINATCDFHSATTRRNFQSAIRNRAILLDYDLSREAIGCILRSETLTLRQRDRNPQDIVICGGCYNRLRKGETDFFPVFYRTELKWISRKGENRRLRILAFRKDDKAQFCVLGNLSQTTKSNPSFGVLTGGSYTEDIRFVLPTAEHLTWLFTTKNTNRRVPPLKASSSKQGPQQSQPSSDAIVHIVDCDIEIEAPRQQQATISAKPTASKSIPTTPPSATLSDIRPHTTTITRAPEGSMDHSTAKQISSAPTAVMSNDVTTGGPTLPGPLVAPCTGKNASSDKIAPGDRNASDNNKTSGITNTPKSPQQPRSSTTWTPHSVQVNPSPKKADLKRKRQPEDDLATQLKRLATLKRQIDGVKTEDKSLDTTIHTRTAAAKALADERAAELDELRETIQKKKALVEQSEAYGIS